jgi:hypothetical protein
LTSMTAKANKNGRNANPKASNAPDNKVTPPSIGDIWEPTPSWIARTGDALSRFPTQHFIVLGVLTALVAVTAIFLRDSASLTVLGLIGTLTLALLIVGFGSVAFFASRNYHATTQQQRGDQPPQPGDGS